MFSKRRILGYFVVICILITSTTSIPCDFKFSINYPSFPDDIERKIEIRKLTNITLTSSQSDFECDEPDDYDDDDFLPETTTTKRRYSTTRRTTVTSTTTKKSVDEIFTMRRITPSRNMTVETTTKVVTNRNSFDFEDDSESLCQSQAMVITPKALNTIYNVLKPVINTQSFIQTISTEQCTEKKAKCDYSETFPQRANATCRQRYTKITLKSLRGKDIVDEIFYYPSHCECRISKF